MGQSAACGGTAGCFGFLQRSAPERGVAAGDPKGGGECGVVGNQPTVTKQSESELVETPTTLSPSSLPSEPKHNVGRDGSKIGEEDKADEDNNPKENVPCKTPPSDEPQHDVGRDWSKIEEEDKTDEDNKPMEEVPCKTQPSDEPMGIDVTDELMRGDWQENDVKDLSFATDMSLIKFIVEPSPFMMGHQEEAVTATDGSKVEVYVAWRALKSEEEHWPDPYEAFTDGTIPQKYQFTLGNCEHCDALELCVASMQMMETSVVRCGCKGDGDLRSWTDEALGLLPQSPEFTPAALVGKFAPVDIMITLISFQKEKDAHQVTPQYRLDYAVARKEAALKYFRAERYNSAIHRYKMIQEVLTYTDDIRDSDLLNEIRTLKRLAQANEAMCCLKMGDTSGTVTTCTKLLEDDPKDEKALYRRASAYLKQGRYKLAKQDLKCCVEINPGNKAAHELFQKCKAEAQKPGVKRFI